MRKLILPFLLLPTLAFGQVSTGSTQGVNKPVSQATAVPTATPQPTATPGSAGITSGVTTITSGTDTAICYDAAGVIKCDATSPLYNLATSDTAILSMGTGFFNVDFLSFGTGTGDEFFGIYLPGDSLAGSGMLNIFRDAATSSMSFRSPSPHGVDIGFIAVETDNGPNPWDKAQQVTVQGNGAAGSGVWLVGNGGVRMGNQTTGLEDWRTATGHPETVQTAPAVTNTSANSCGTDAATLVGTDSAGKITVGATSGTSCTVTFTTTWTNAPACIANDETTAVATKAISTTTTVIISGTFTAADKVSYVCMGYH